MEEKFGRTSFFDGNILNYIGISVLSFLITVCTLGILSPLAIVLKYGWFTNHRVVNGKRLHFSGSALGLFGNWIKWFLLSIITLGIYSFWLTIKLEDWKAKNTHFLEE
ncbi:DUF898 family protein [Fructobacillus sp. W13]|uniref:DUF898 family protein n=1 Tax=Fructobacillus apis TaxID=2935017 RepID=A0ABT0ZPL3_9LACO|nr:DUF898 family protein [Fructobacillus apis]MCO0831893.1 DUF898 family protein [Fructobacillus apis]